MAEAPDFTWKDIAYCAGLVLSIYNLWRSLRKDRYDPLFTNFFVLLDAFEADAAALSDEIGRYLQKTEERKEYEDLLRMDKACLRQLKKLKCRLPEVDWAKLQSAYSDWWRVQSETPFAKTMRNRAAQAEIVIRQEAHAALIVTIDAVRRAVLDKKTKVVLSDP